MNYPFLAINIIDTYNQGWISWIKACLQLAHSEDTPHAQTTPEELKYAFKILSNIPTSIMQASQKNNMGEWTNPCTLYLNMQKEKETVEPKKQKNNDNDTNPRPRQGGGGYHQNRPFLNLHQDIGGYHQDRQDNGGYHSNNQFGGGYNPNYQGGGNYHSQGCGCYHQNSWN